MNGLRVKQSRAGSLMEAACNVGMGFVLALLVQRSVYPAFGIHTTWTTDTIIAAIFTMVSLARGYLLRRLFEWLEA